MSTLRLLVCITYTLSLVGCGGDPLPPDKKVVEDPNKPATQGWVSEKLETQHKAQKEGMENQTRVISKGLKDLRTELKGDWKEINSRLGTVEDRSPPTAVGYIPNQPGASQPQSGSGHPAQQQDVLAGLSVQQQVEAGVAAALKKSQDDQAAKDAAAAAEEAKVRRYEEAARRGAAEAINQALPGIQEMLDQKMAALHEQGMDKNLQVTRGVVHQTLQEFYHPSQMKVMPELSTASPPTNVVRTTQYYQYFVPGGCVTVWPYGYGGRVHWRCTPYNYYPYGRR